METEIQRFFRDKNVLVTGGTGFIGKVLIEKILRTTDVARIYVLARDKKDKNMHERFDAIFRDALFDKLLKLKKDARKRVIPILGDCSMPNLGLSTEDRQTLVEQVDIILHGAATVRFNEPLCNALAINTRATLDLLYLAKKMLKLKAFVHVSSAFANCLQKNVDEIYYTEKLGITAENACRLADLLGPNLLNSTTNAFLKEFPNTYTYTKALAEEAILSHGSGLPVCIFRPSIVIQSCSDPVPGWIDNFYGPTSILFGSASGVLRVMYVRESANASMVPVDFCANTIIACAWHVGTTVNQIIPSEPPIFNLVPEDSNAIRWRDYKSSVKAYGSQFPLTRMIWYPFLICTDSKLLYAIYTFWYHTIPGFLLDGLLFLIGKKRRFVKIYRKIHKQTKLLQYFSEQCWNFKTDNTKALWKSLSVEDQELYNFDMMTIDWYKYMYNSLYGMRQYLLMEDPSSIPKAQLLWQRFFLLHQIVRVVVYGGLLFLFIWLLRKIA